MRRTIAIAAYLCAVIAEVATLGVAEAASTEASAPTIKTSVGPMRLLSPDFGYAAAYKEVWQGDTAKITLALFVYDHGRWSNVTPPHIRGDGIGARSALAFR